MAGAVLSHPSGFAVALHRDQESATALAAFALISVTVGGPEEMSAWTDRLDDLKVEHSELRRVHLGWYTEIAGPGGLVVRLRTAEWPDADDA